MDTATSALLKELDVSSLKDTQSIFQLALAIVWQNTTVHHGSPRGCDTCQVSSVTPVGRFMLYLGFFYRDVEPQALSHCHRGVFSSLSAD